MHSIVAAARAKNAPASGTAKGRWAKLKSELDPGTAGEAHEIVCGLVLSFRVFLSDFGFSCGIPPASSGVVSL